jgi:hypothetical protein
MFHLLHPGFGLIGLVLNILVAIWVHNDASKRGGDAILWAIGTVLCCPIVPIIYLIVRKPVLL